MNQAAIHPLSHELASDFVKRNHKDCKTAMNYVRGRSSLIVNIELWLITASGLVIVEHGLKRVQLVRRKAAHFYRNDFMSKRHDTNTRLDITADLGYAMLDFIGATAEEIALYDLWQDMVLKGELYARRHDDCIDPTLL